MAKLRQLIDTLHQATGIARTVIERTARNLADAGYLPDAKTDFLPYDAAVLLVALAAGRSPSEAIEAMDGYQSAPLTRIIDPTPNGDREVDLDNPAMPLNAIEEYRPAKENVIQALSMLLSEMPGRTLDHQSSYLYAEIARLDHVPLAVLVVSNGVAPRRMIFSRPSDRESSGWSIITSIGSDTFAVIAKLLDEPALDMSAPQSHVYH
jgi:hypothetical protein